MSELHNSSVKRLAELFERCKAEILSDWHLEVAQLLKDLHLDTPTMVDHMPDVVNEIIRDLALRRDGAISEEHLKGSPPVHGVQRFHDGLDLGDVVAEYNFLRVSFIRIAERNGLYVIGEAAHIINSRIDEAIKMAVTAYAAQQALIRKEQSDEHLAFISHDLRTPLNAISLLCEELKETMDVHARANTAELFEILQRNLDRVAALIQKGLDSYAKPLGCESSFRPERRTFELWPLVQRLIIDLRAVSTKHTIEVINEISPALTIFADAGLISQVFQNLLGNAFKYASKGRVVVSAEETDDTVICTVRDDGAGIPLEMLSNVFDKLATDPAKEGTGLGLAIVKQIVEAHGGTVTAQSVHGAGAAFSFVLPKEETAAPTVKD